MKLGTRVSNRSGIWIWVKTWTVMVLPTNIKSKSKRQPNAKLVAIQVNIMVFRLGPFIEP